MSTGMVSQRRWTFFLLVLGIGLVLGMSLGWLLPIRRSSTDLNRLHPDYKADYVLMVGDAYSLDGDWVITEARLAALGEADMSTYVGRLADRYIAEGRNLNDIRSLIGLSVQLGYISPQMEPYLPAQIPGG